MGRCERACRKRTRRRLRLDAEAKVVRRACGFHAMQWTMGWIRAWQHARGTVDHYRRRPSPTQRLLLVRTVPSTSVGHLAARWQIHLLVSLCIRPTSRAPVQSRWRMRHLRRLPEKKLTSSKDLAGGRSHPDEHDHVSVRPVRENSKKTASGPLGLVRRRSRGCQLGSSRAAAAEERSHVDVLRGADPDTLDVRPYAFQANDTRQATCT